MCVGQMRQANDNKMGINAASVYSGDIETI